MRLAGGALGVAVHVSPVARFETLRLNLADVDVLEVTVQLTAGEIDGDVTMVLTMGRNNGLMSTCRLDCPVWLAER
jgi:hypothetical protein